MSWFYPEIKDGDRVWTTPIGVFRNFNLALPFATRYGIACGQLLSESLGISTYSYLEGTGEEPEHTWTTPIGVSRNFNEVVL